jgi:ParB-like chromosome segregation protein Spo0J
MRTGLVQIHPALEPLLVDIDSVSQHPSNPNNGDLEEICASIEINGLYRPVYVQASTGYIVAGNGTWTAAKMLDADQIPVIMLDVDDLTAKRIMLADNKIAALATRDPALELALLKELDSLLGTGYQPYEVEKMEALLDIPPEPGEFDVWPTLCVQVSPEVRTAYYQMTDAAGGETERFEMLLRLAGWTS